MNFSPTPNMIAEKAGPVGRIGAQADPGPAIDKFGQSLQLRFGHNLDPRHFSSPPVFHIL